MGYSVDDLEPGQVLLMLRSQRAPWYDRLLGDGIAWSSGPFVHAAFVGNGQIIEQLARVETSPLAKYAVNGWAFRIEGMTPDLAQAMTRWGLARLQQPYGYRAMLEDAALYDLHDWRELRARPTFPVCSGFVERAARLGAGIALTEQPLPSPTSLAFSPRLIGPRPWARPAADPNPKRQPDPEKSMSRVWRHTR